MAAIDIARNPDRTVVALVRLDRGEHKIMWCSDLDDDCNDVTCKTCCWLYQPWRGLCPYLYSQEDL
jgi:uncharacterized OB-fold protein